MNLTLSSLVVTARNFLSYFRLTPFDVSTSDGRNKERYRRLLLSSSASVAAKGISLLTTLISVPLTLHYLGQERYGLWMTISSIITLLGFADLGLGNGLINLVSEADGQEDRALARRGVSSGTFMLLAIGLTIAVVFAVVNPLLNWRAILNLTGDLAAAEAGPAILVFIACFTASMPLGVVQRVQLGYQEGFQNNIWQSIGNILGLVGVLICIQLELGLPWLVFAMAGMPVVASLLNFLDQFLRQRPWLLPNPAVFHWETARRLAGVGGIFFILQVFALIGGESVDNLVITRVLGASAVSLYAVTQKYFTIALLAQIFLTPLWPAFGEALARNDQAWVRKAFSRAVVVSVGGIGLFSLVLLLVGKPVIQWWAGAAMVPGLALLIGTAFLALMNSYKGCISMLYSVGPLLKTLLPYFVIASLVSLALKTVFCYWYGVSGVVWGGVIAYTLLMLAPLTVITWRKFYQLPVEG